MGELDTAKTGLWILHDQWDGTSQKGLMKVNNKYIHAAKTALALVESIKDQDVIIRSLGVSGVLKKAREKYIAA